MSSRVGVVVRPSLAAIVRRSVPKSRRSPLICVASWRTVMVLVSGSGVWLGRIALVIPRKGNAAVVGLSVPAVISSSRAADANSLLTLASRKSVFGCVMA